MNVPNQHVLIAVDGSAQSIKAAHYAARILNPKKARLTLLLIESPVPETLWDNQPDATNVFAPPIANGWWEAQLEENRKSLDTVRKNFLEAGFPEPAVEAKISPRRSGIARDLIKESKKGYDLVVAGRTGHNIHTGATLGNCARKLVSALTHTTLIIVGDHPDCRKVLIGFDASEGSRRCLAMAGQWLTPDIERIRLCYVSRSLNLMSGTMDPFQASLDAYNIAEQEHQISQRNRMLPQLRAAEDLLLKSGFSRTRVDSIIMKSYMSRSEGLISEAMESGYGTIMVGRRGHSLLEEFFLGRVGDKLVQLAEDRAVWIVH